MDTHLDTALQAEIRAFLDETGMGESYFGRQACGNTELFKRLVAGKSVRTDTFERVMAFLAEHSGCEPEWSDALERFKEAMGSLRKARGRVKTPPDCGGE